MLEELNQIHASEELIQETLQYCKDNKSSGRTINNTETNSARVKGITRKINRWAVAAAACAGIVVMSSGVAFAYNQVTGESIFKAIYKVINTASSLNYSKGITDNNGNSYIYDNKNNVNTTKTDKDLTVTLDSYVVDGTTANFLFNVKTNDNTPINDVNENKIPIIARDGFADLKISIDGEILNPSELSDPAWGQIRVDDGSDPTFASIMIDIHAPRKNTLVGSVFTFEMSNYTSTYEYLESVDFKYSNVAEMLSGQTLADDSSVSGDNTMYGYINTDIELSPGNMHITFSDKYPDTYIDNAGYTLKERKDSKTFIMTIVPENENVANELLNLCFQNTSSGFPTRNNINRLSDGRIQIQYAADTDFTISKLNDGIKTNTNNEHLSNLVIKKYLSDEPSQEIICSKSGSFTFNCVLNDNENVITTNTDIIVNDPIYTDTTLNIKTIAISVTSLKLTGYINIDQSIYKKFVTNNVYSPLITMKNGTSFRAGNKCGASWNEKTVDENQKNWQAEWLLPTYIKPSDVQSITWHGATIYEAE